ncbi:hypothetical protein GCM10028791_16080 [Echinicola sediminis]
MMSKANFISFLEKVYVLVFRIINRVEPILLAPEMCLYPVDGHGNIKDSIIKISGQRGNNFPIPLFRIMTVLATFCFFASCTSSADPLKPNKNPSDENVNERSAPIFLEGQDPKPESSHWELIPEMSDEFNESDDRSESGLNPEKWRNGPNEIFPWKGSSQCLFSEETVKVDHGNSNAATITVDQLSEKMETREYAGGIIRSKFTAEPGTYFEARMKANKTQMSSSFWVINAKKEIPDGQCKRTTELDIQESVGQLKQDYPQWASKWTHLMHSNVLNRQTSEDCSPYEDARNENRLDLEEKVWEDYHVYGCWWKSPDLLIFFLDGKEVYRMNPKSGPFSFPMYLTMSSNVYDWNQYPVDTDGMQGMSAEDRTTTFDWVRTWKLE